MASSSEASRSDSSSETDDDESTEFPAVEDPMTIIMSLLSQTLPSSITTLFQRAETDDDSHSDDSQSSESQLDDSQSDGSQPDDSQSDNSQQDNSQKDDSQPGESHPDESQPDDCQSYDSLFDDTPSESSTTNEHDKADKFLKQEEQVDKINFSELIEALIQCQLDKTEVSDQRRQAPGRDLLEEHMREEALILDNLAGPGATAAQRKKVADDAAEVRQRLADRSIESVAESVARAGRARPSRAPGVAVREADEYALELASTRRLVRLALEEDPDGAALRGLTVFQRMSLRPLRTVLHGPDFQRLIKDAGSFDDAVKCLFDILWPQKKAIESLLRADKEWIEEKGKGKAEE
ncbi:hypothetical protein VSDG_05710 [Cytospora chrysosperma]|uniref:Uncharacterized protein n=1 Tax=Cytospora chrysosperma TaxID=252740 RepID=A0A423VT22_CYTCH|nr:hypothetical protein VSDG_05710 [Valsa sordida]